MTIKQLFYSLILTVAMALAYGIVASYLGIPAELGWIAGALFGYISVQITNKYF